MHNVTVNPIGDTCVRQQIIKIAHQIMTLNNIHVAVFWPIPGRNSIHKAIFQKIDYFQFNDSQLAIIW